MQVNSSLYYILYVQVIFYYESILLNTLLLLNSVVITIYELISILSVNNDILRVQWDTTCFYIPLLEPYFKELQCSVMCTRYQAILGKLGGYYPASKFRSLSTLG